MREGRRRGCRCLHAKARLSVALSELYVAGVRVGKRGVDGEEGRAKVAQVELEHYLGVVQAADFVVAVEAVEADLAETHDVI